MKKVNLLIFSTFIHFFSCDTLKGHRGISDSEKSSQNQHTYLKSYSVVENGLQNKITNKDSIWLEKDWYYGGFFRENRIGNYFRMIIKLDNYLKYDTLWCVGTENGNLFENNGNLAHHLFTEMPKDTIRLNIYTKNKEVTSDSLEIILLSKNILK